MVVSKLQGQFVAYVPKQSVGYPKVLIMPLGKLITRVLVPGICEFLFWGDQVGSSLQGTLGFLEVWMYSGCILIYISIFVLEFTHAWELGSAPGP